MSIFSWITVSVIYCFAFFMGAFLFMSIMWGVTFLIQGWTQKTICVWSTYSLRQKRLCTWKSCNAGNVHDSVAFDDVYDKLVERYPEIETIVVDSAYKTSHICKKIFDDGRVISTAYKRPMTKKGGYEWGKYVYDEYYDCIICPEYQVLDYRTTNRDGYREYKSNPMICKDCPTRQLCTDSRDYVKTVNKHNRGLHRLVTG